MKRWKSGKWDALEENLCQFGNILENDEVPVLILLGKETVPVLSGNHYLMARILIFQYAPIHRGHKEYCFVCLNATIGM